MDNARQGACNLQTILSEKGFSFSLSDVQEFLDVLEGVALKLIITNVPSEVFKYDIAQGCFEDLFKSFDDQSKFVYLPSFHRVLEACTPNNQRQLLTMYPNDLKPIYNDCRYIYMNRPEAVLLARLRTQGWTLPKHVYDSIPCSSMSLNSSGINCFIGDFEDSNDANESNKEEEYNYCDNPECMVNSDEYLVNETEDCKENSDFQSTPLIKDDAETNISVSFSLNEVCKHGKYKRRGLGCSMKHLAPPKPSRLFLLSPPSSPPVGWEPKPECEPVINYELLQALASLAPGEAFELHPCDQVKHHPSIVVTPCETGPMYDKDMKKTSNNTN